MSSPDFPAWIFQFPSVMSRLDWAEKLSPWDYRCLAVDGERLLRKYWAEMCRAVQYERFIHSDANRRNPDMLTQENLSNAFDLGARGFSYSALCGWMDKPIRALAEIDPEADAFVTEDFDRKAAGLFADLCMVRGVKAANATKILYQKRPRLFPVLDQYARCAVNVPYIGNDDRKDYEQVLLLALRRVREVGSTGANAATLARLESIGPEVTTGIRLSRVRIIDILAWMAVGQGEG